MRNTIYTFVLALSLLAVQPSWASSGYGSQDYGRDDADIMTVNAAASDTCSAPEQSSTATPNDSPAPQNVIEYGAGG